MSVTVTQSELDKFRATARDAIVAGAVDRGLIARPEEIYDRPTRAMVAFKPAGTGLAKPLKIVANLLERAGVPRDLVDNLGKPDLARLVCGADPYDMGLPISAQAAHFNVTGMFQNIVLDAQNVLLRQSYNDANTTFQVWAKKGEPVENFKDVHRIIAGEIATDPKAIPEDGEFEETTLSEGREVYRVTVFGHMLSLTWQLLMNDSASALTDAPVKLVRSMKRKQNRMVYATLKANANMADGGALFNGTATSSPGGHANLTTGAVSDYAAAFATMIAKMAVQKGLSADSGALNLTPSYVMFPPALADKIGTLLRSTYIPGGTNSTDNIYQGSMVPVQDAELGTAFGGSDVAFYHAANSADIDTIEYAHLAGFENPVVESQPTFNRIGLRFRMYQPFAVKPLDWRGLQKHAGA